VKIGIVCPYDWSVPGGVMAHIDDLARELIDRGHSVSVLAPVSDPTGLPSFVVNGGEPVKVSYNGSVARLAFGFGPAQRVRRWIRTGHFDVIHIHEPLTPSLSSLACWAASGAVVGTFHSAMDRSRVMSAGYGLAQTVLEKLSGRIAVSEAARRTVVEHVGGDAVIIPNGIHVRDFVNVVPLDGARDPQRICFLGRFEEPRKGFSILLDAFVQIAAEFPMASLVVAGPGDAEAAVADVPGDVKSRIRFLGRVSDEEKASMLAGSAVYVAPNTGGESFGIVLLEAMASGTPVVASDLLAFASVLNDGKAGRLFVNGDAESLATQLRSLLADPAERDRLTAAGSVRVRRFDWSRVAPDIIDVYETVTITGEPVEEDLRGQIVGRISD